MPATRAMAVVAVALATILAAALVMKHAVALGLPRAPVRIASAWKGGKRVGRTILTNDAAKDAAPPTDLAALGEVVFEDVDAEAKLFAWPTIAFSMGLVPSRDGVRAELDGKTAYVTPDDLLAQGAYDHGVALEELSISTGTDVELVAALLAAELHVGARDVLDRATLTRVRMHRVRPAVPDPPWAHVTAAALDAATVRGAALDAARFLARGMKDDGRFRYIVDAATNATLGGYDWPRHAGATYFLAQAAGLSHDPELAAAALRAAALLRDGALLDCGGDTCVGVGDRVEIGSSGLAVVAFAEIARQGLDVSYRDVVRKITPFLRAQQRPDGEFMHFYDRRANRREDVQLLYFSGEATLALARASALLHSDEDLEAARRGLAHLVGSAWSFFGDRYYFGEEHWTCQAVADLWDRAPDPKALDFCLRWNAYGRRLQHVEGDSPLDAEGAYSVDPVVTPRLTPVASRCEAAVATLAAAKKAAGVDPREIAALDLQLRRSLALVVRKQFRPGPSHLFADPDAVYGAIPGSDVDWQLRIDYAQHAGSAMIRWLEVSF